MMKAKKAYFRFEASPEIGAGHAMRSTVIADALAENGWDCQIVTSQESYDFIKNLDRFKRVEPDVFYQKPAACDLLVVDHYDLDHTYESHFRPSAKKIMVIDDLADRKHDCDILLNHNFGYSVDCYNDSVSKNCQIFAGQEYIVVEKSFFKVAKKRRQFNKLLLYMGGTVNINFVKNILHSLSGKYRVALISGFSDRVSENELDGIEQYFEKNEILKAYEWADISVGFAGQGMFERYIMGIPCLVFSQNEMQHNVLKKIGHTNIKYCGDIKQISSSLIIDNMECLEKSYQYSTPIQEKFLSSIMEIA